MILVANTTTLHYTTTSVLLPCNPHFQHALVLNCHDSCSCVAVWSIYQLSYYHYPQQLVLVSNFGCMILYHTILVLSHLYDSLSPDCTDAPSALPLLRENANSQQEILNNCKLDGVLVSPHQHCCNWRALRIRTNNNRGSHNSFPLRSGKVSLFMDKQGAKQSLLWLMRMRMGAAGAGETLVLPLRMMLMTDNWQALISTVTTAAMATATA